MEVAEEVSAKRIAKRKVGKTLKVLVDEINADGGIGRTAADAPEIDGVVYIAPAAEGVQALQGRRFRVGEDHRRRRPRPVGRGLSDDPTWQPD